MLLWTDSRNESFRNLDVYGARLAFDGGLLDPAGFPVVAGPLAETDPALGSAGDGYVVAWAESTGARFRLLRRALSSAGAVGPVTVVVPDGDNHIAHPQLASGPRSALLLWRDLIPRRAFAQVVFPDGGAGPVRDLGASDVSFAPVDLDAVWTGDRWFVGYSNLATVLTVDAFEDGGSSAPVAVSTGGGPVYHLSVAASPSGARALAWRADNFAQGVGQVFAMVLPPGPVTATDAGVRLTTGDEPVSGVDVDWTDAGFLVAYARAAPGSDHRLFGTLLPESGGLPSPVVNLADAGQASAAGPHTSVRLVGADVFQVVGPSAGWEHLRQRTIDVTGPLRVTRDERLVVTGAPQEFGSLAFEPANGFLLRVWRQPSGGGLFDVWAEVLENESVVVAGPTRIASNVEGQPWPQAAWGGGSWWVTWQTRTDVVLVQLAGNLTTVGRD
jgi:hypothetical protein